VSATFSIFGWIIIFATVFSFGFALGARYAHREPEIVYPTRGDKLPSVTNHQMQLTREDRQIDSTVASYNRKLKS
jgi:hypothetical protein